MKQLLICKSGAVYDATVDANDHTDIEEGTLVFKDLVTGAICDPSDGKIANNFSIILNRGDNVPPFIIPEVDVKTLKVAFSENMAGSNFSAAFTVPTPEVGYTYTAIIAKKGVTFNERNKWTVSAIATNTTAATVASELAKQINASSETSGVSASVSGATITVTGTNYQDYEVILADELTGVSVTVSTEGVAPVLDKAWVKDLASKCAAGKGFNYLAEDGKEIYPGYPEAVEDVNYIMFTLTFAVGRDSAKTRDERVQQVVHIVCQDPDDYDDGESAPTPLATDLEDMLLG